MLSLWLTLKYTTNNQTQLIIGILGSSSSPQFSELLETHGFSYCPAQLAPLGDGLKHIICTLTLGP